MRVGKGLLILLCCGRVFPEVEWFDGALVRRMVVVGVDTPYIFSGLRGIRVKDF